MTEEKAKNKIFKILKSKSIEELKEVVTLLNERLDADADKVFDIALDFLLKIMPPKEFVAFCETL